MSRPQQSIVFPFPINGVAELGPYEGQISQTTPHAKNVRGFAWVDNNGTPERGRLGGGQRPGIRNYHAAGNKASFSGEVTGAGIQDVIHISSDSIELLSGGDEFVHRDGTYLNVGGDAISATEAPGGSMTNRRVDGCVWDDENNLYVAVVNEVAGSVADEQVQLVKYTHTDTTGDGSLDTWKAQWTSNTYSSTNTGDPEEEANPTGWKWILQGIAWYGKFVYLRLFYDNSSANTKEKPIPSERVVRIDIGHAAQTGADATDPTKGPSVEPFIHDRQGSSPESKGNKGWRARQFDGSHDPLGDACQGNGLAISKGRIAILSIDTTALTVWQKIIETGETVVVPDGTTSRYDSGSTTDSQAREICGDSGGNFWVVGATADNSALLRITQDGTTTALTAAKSDNSRPETVCFDPISNRVHIAGGAEILGLKNDKFATATVTLSKDGITSTDGITLEDTYGGTHAFVGSTDDPVWDSTVASDAVAATNLATVINASSAPFSAESDDKDVTITQDIAGVDGETAIVVADASSAGISKTDFTGGGGNGSFASYHAFEAILEFNSGNINPGGNNLIRLRENPFAVNDKVVLSTTGSVPTGLTDGTTYRVSSISQSGTTNLHTIGLQYDAGGDGHFNDTPSISDVGVSGEVFKLTRSAAEPARVVTRHSNALAPEAGSHIVFDPKTNADGFVTVRPRTGGGVYLAKSDQKGGMQKSNIDASFQTGSMDTATDATGIKMASNAIYGLDSDLRSATRQTALVVVSGGTIKRVTDIRFPSVDAGDYALSASEPVIFSVTYKSNIYYVDGVNSKIYKHVVTDGGTRGSVVDWDVDKYDATEIEQRELINATFGKDKGVFPVDDQGNKPRLIEVWDERIVLAGILGRPQEWFMSRRGTPDDFHYGIKPRGDEIACAGFFGETPAGLMADKINAIVPYSDDVLIFGGDHTIHQLSGNPATGAVPDLISDTVGMAWGRAWCKDPSGVLYFFGSRGGVFRMAPGSIPQNMTTTSIAERLYGINLKTNVIRMVWNDREQGVHLFVSPTDKTLAGEHYFYDMKGNGWWIDEFDSKDGSVYVHNTTCPHVFDGDDANDRVILLGGREGRLYKWDISSPDDYVGITAKAVDSKVLLGPINSSVGSKMVLTELMAILAANSSGVSYDVLVGNTAESIISDLGTTSTGGRPDNGRRRLTGTFVAGRDRVERRRAVAADMFVQLRNNVVGENWALERLIVTLGSAGRRTNRTLDYGGMG